jgi:hypothetical protein
MATVLWSKTNNFFLAIVQRTKVGAKAIFDALDANLQAADADADIMVLYLIFHPLCVDFDAKYLVWDSLKSSNLSNTLGVKDLLAELSSTNIREWDIAIQAIYDQTSTRYKALLPHRRTPFQEGKTSLRVAAIANLLVAIGTDASLATLKTDVLAFQSDLNTAIATSSSQNTPIVTATTNLGTAVVAGAVGMMGVYGGLIKQYYKTLLVVNDIFPVALLLKIKQTDFTATLKTLLPKKLFKRKLESTQHLVGINPSNNIVLAYFTNGLTSVLAPGDPFISMPAITMANYTLAQAGYSDTKRCLFVRNTAAGDANVEIDVV